MLNTLADSITHTLIALPLTPVMWLGIAVLCGCLMFVMGWVIRAQISKQQKNTLIEIIQASELRLAQVKSRLSSQRQSYGESHSDFHNETGSDLSDTRRRDTTRTDLDQSARLDDSVNAEYPELDLKDSRSAAEQQPAQATEHRRSASQTAEPKPGQSGQSGRRDDEIPVMDVKPSNIQILRKSYEETRRRHTEELIAFRTSLKQLKQRYSIKLEKQAQTLAAQEKEATAKIETLNHSLSMNRHKIAGLIAEVERYKSVLEDLRHTREQYESGIANVAGLQQRIDTLTKDNQGYQLDITRLNSELRSVQLQREQHSGNAQYDSLSSTQETSASKHQRNWQQHSQSDHSPSTEDSGQRDESVQRKSLNHTTRNPDPTTSSDQLQPQARQTPAGSDDLKQIKGIGPVLETALNQQGIHLFSQIAAFSDDDIERIASLINTAAKRIRRERWVAAAATLESNKFDQEVT